MYKEHIHLGALIWFELLLFSEALCFDKREKLERQEEEKLVNMFTSSRAPLRFST